MQRALSLFILLALFAPLFPVPLIAQEVGTATPPVDTASTTPEEEGGEEGAQSAPSFSLLSAPSDESFVPAISGTVISESPASAWNPANWTGSQTINYPYGSINIAGDPNFIGPVPNFVQDGRVTTITMPLGFTRAPDDLVTFQLTSDPAHGWYDCKTQTKTAAQWGLGTTPGSFNTVTIGPFDGAHCDTRIQRKDLGTHLTAGVDGVYGSFVTMPVTSDGATPIVVYAANPPGATRITADITADRTLESDQIYVVSGTVLIAPGATVTVEPGAIVKFDHHSGFSVYGSFVAHGTSTNPIYLTSFTDDAVGGDTNEDGATLAQAGNWDGIVSNGGTISIESAIVRYGSYRMLVGDKNTLSIHTSSITNAVDGIHNYDWSPQNAVSAENNWWGDANGPASAGSQGTNVYGAVSFTPWLATDPFAIQTPTCTENCNSSVLFLPGIKGSRLYGGDGLLWEPGDDQDVEALSLTPLGKSVRNDIFVKKDGVLSSVGVLDFYEEFIQDMDTLAFDHQIQAFEAVPYDWRLSLDDIINNGREIDGEISYLNATSTPYIEQTLRRLAADSYTEKVTIIAHSNGGLVTKALLEKLGDAETANLVDKVIFVGVPQSGAPRAVGALLYGDQEEIPENIGTIVSAATAREFSQNSPMPYHLLPSQRYFSDVQDGNHPVGIFLGTTGFTEERAAYGNVIATSDELKNFLKAAEGGRTKPAPDDLEKANILNSMLLEYGQQTHASIDNWTPPASVEVHQIAGWGLDTIAGIEFYKECGLSTCGDKYRPDFVEDGDKVVTVPSAIMMSTSTENIHSYWANLRKTGLIGPLGRKDHGTLFEIEGLQEFVSNLVLNSDITLPDIISTESPEINNPEKKLRFFLHSPLTLELYDEDGNHLGIDEQGNYESEIEGATYGEFGEVKYIIAPAGKEYRLEMHGIADGHFSLDIQEAVGSEVINESTIADVPSTANTVAKLTIEDTVAFSSPLEVDTDGNGSSDFAVSFTPGETVFYQPDIVAPVTVATTTGTIGLNSWYLGTTTVTLSATDAGSGVGSTSYAIDTGPWQTYTAPFVIGKEGTTTLQFYSIDNASNREATSTKVITIDKTAPEAVITFDASSKTLKVARTDNLSATSTQVAIGTALSTIVKDAAGNQLTIAYSKNEQKSNSASLTLASLKYESAATMTATSTMRYYWLNGSNASKPSVLLAYVKSNQGAVLALYVGSSNITIVMTATPQDETANLATLATSLVLKPRVAIKQYIGLVIPYVFTQSGKVRIGY